MDAKFYEAARHGRWRLLRAWYYASLDEAWRNATLDGETYLRTHISKSL